MSTEEDRTVSMRNRKKTTIDERRAAMGPSAVLSPTKAAELLPVRETEALAWLRGKGLVIEDPELGDVVIWGDVLEMLRQQRPATKGRKKAATTAKELMRAQL